VSRLSSQLKKEKKKVLELQEQMSSQETIWSKEHQAQLDHLTEENRISLDSIEQLRTEIDNVKYEHDRQLVVLLDEKKEMRKNHENQVDTLVAQLNELKIKIKNSEILRKEAVELNKKLASLQELFYAKLYEIKNNMRNCYSLLQNLKHSLRNKK
jgi:DNA repair exonuclease SbcCD ATPase subunit